MGIEIVLELQGSLASGGWHVPSDEGIQSFDELPEWIHPSPVQQIHPLWSGVGTPLIVSNKSPPSPCLYSI